MKANRALLGLGFAALVMAMAASAGAAAKGVLEGVGPVLGKHFTAQPISPPLPNHLWMEVGDGQLRFLHFDKPVSDPSARVVFIGEAIKGRFCAQDQPDGGKTGFVHFHRAEKPSGMEHGHGGLTGESGYWLRHVALGEVEMMGNRVGPGIVMTFMPTPPPLCQ